jgi:CubicO group peptidase (beta-lactamase class C family)
LPEVSVPEIDRCIARALSDKLVAGAACVASIEGRLFHRAVYGSLAPPPPIARLQHDTLFDLGGLTRPLCTALLAAHLVSRNRLDLSATVASVLKDFVGTPLGDLPLDMLLDHTSGMPATADLWRPIHKADLRRHPQERLGGSPKAVPELRKALTQVTLAQPPGAAVGVSDPAYLLMGWALEAVTGKGLDAVAEAELYRPLELHTTLTYMPLPAKRSLVKRTFAATSKCPWRARLMQGEAQDLLAWMGGGVAGHAGLFGTATAVWRLCEAVRESASGKSRAFHAGTLARFFTRSRRVHDTPFTMGWDTPSRDNGMGNGRFSRSSVGQVDGGAAFWIDPVNAIVGVLLTDATGVAAAGKEAELAKMRTRVFDLIASNAASAPLAAGDALNELIRKLKPKTPSRD